MGLSKCNLFLQFGAKFHKGGRGKFLRVKWPRGWVGGSRELWAKIFFIFDGFPNKRIVVNLEGSAVLNLLANSVIAL